MTPSLPQPVSALVDHESSPTPDFRTLYRRYYRLVWWVVRGSGVPEAWVEDVVHDAFLVLHRRRHERDADTPVRSWVIGIARNAAFSHRRGAARRKARHSAVPEPERPSAVDSVVAYRQAWDQVRRFLSELDDQQREAFVLCELQGVAPAEVAHSLRVSRNTVYSRLRLARSKLVDHFSERPATELPGLVRAARRQGQPTPAQKRRAWAALAIHLPLDMAAPAGTTGASLGAWAVTGKAALVSVGLAVVVVGALGLVGRAGSRPAASKAAAVGTDPEPADARPSTPPTEPRAPTLRPPSPEPAASSPEPARALGPSTATKPRTTPTTAAPSLDDDIALLRQAAQQLEGGESRAALTTLGHHAERHPTSVMADERLGLRVRALCAIGSTGQAEALAARYIADHPETRLAAALADPCRGPSR